MGFFPRGVQVSRPETRFSWNPPPHNGEAPTLWNAMSLAMVFALLAIFVFQLTRQLRSPLLQRPEVENPLRRSPSQPPRGGS
jgi:hypothetical protein